MSIVRAATEPCWVVDFEPDDRDYEPHFATAAEAKADLDPEDVDGTLRQEARVCVALLCDGCDQYLGMEELDDSPNYHLDPSDVTQILEHIDWTTTASGKHYCDADDCYEKALTEDEPQPTRDLSRAPGPDDVPLPIEFAL